MTFTFGGIVALPDGRYIQVYLVYNTPLEEPIRLELGWLDNNLLAEDQTLLTEDEMNEELYTDTFQGRVSDYCIWQIRLRKKRFKEDDDGLSLYS